MKQKEKIMTRWFTSDLHFGHNNIIRYCQRPFRDVHEMHNAMIQTWNETVKEGDEVYVVGDFSLSARYCKEFLPRLNGTKILVVGNHDKPFKHIFKQTKEYST